MGHYFLKYINNQNKIGFGAEPNLITLLSLLLILLGNMGSYMAF